MPPIDDVAGIGKAVEGFAKILQTVADVGLTVTKPRRIRAEARAEAEAKLILTEAEIASAELQARAHQRHDQRELLRQRNLEHIVGDAAGQIPERVDSGPVDPDWTAEFLNCAQDVSNEKMQSLWARILAGEVTTPGTFSRRTLAAVRLLAQDEAELFTRFCSHVWYLNGDYAYVRLPTTSVDDPIFTLGELMHLDHIGLVAGAGGFGTTHRFGANEPYVFRYLSRTFRASTNLDMVGIDTLSLTSIAQELVPIAGGDFDQEYFQRSKAHIEAQGLLLEEINQHAPSA
jgi:Protein of unknown function (DUF2806)